MVGTLTSQLRRCQHPELLVNHGGQLLKHFSPTEALCTVQNPCHVVTTRSLVGHETIQHAGKRLGGPELVLNVTVVLQLALDRAVWRLEWQEAVGITTRGPTHVEA